MKGNNEEHFRVKVTVDSKTNCCVNNWSVTRLPPLMPIRMFSVQLELADIYHRAASCHIRAV